MQEVTDPEILKQLNGSGGHEITDPELLKQLNGEDQGPGTLKSAALGAMSGVPGAETALSALRSIDPNTTYEQAHQGLESSKDAAWKAHPTAYGAGKVAGLVGTGLAAPEGLLGAAAVGGLSGVDASTRPADMVTNALEGAGTGVAVGGALKGLGALANKALPAVGTAGKAAVSMLGKDLTPTDIGNYVKNPSGINNALGKDALGEDFANTIGKLGQDNTQMSAQAQNLLNKNVFPLTAPTAPEISNVTGAASLPSDLENNLKPIFDRLKAGYLQNGQPKGPASESAINALDSQYQRMVAIAKANGGKLSEQDIRGQVSELQEIAKNAFNSENAPAKAEAAKGLSAALNGVLKDSNPAYGDAMEPVQDQTDLLGRMINKFSLKQKSDGTVTPTDLTVGKVMNTIKEGKSESYDMIDHLKDITGVDYLQKIQDSATANNFKTPGLGFGELGKVMSKSVDGGQVAKSILNKYIRARGAVSDPVVQKYGSILANAAKQGGNQLAATHFVLSTSDPVYQKLAADQQDPYATGEGNQPQ